MCFHFLSPWSLLGKEPHKKNRFPEDAESYCIYSEDENSSDHFYRSQAGETGHIGEIR